MNNREHNNNVVSLDVEPGQPPIRDPVAARIVAKEEEDLLQQKYAHVLENMRSEQAYELALAQQQRGNDGDDGGGGSSVIPIGTHLPHRHLPSGGELTMMANAAMEGATTKKKWRIRRGGYRKKRRRTKRRKRRTRKRRRRKRRTRKRRKRNRRRKTRRRRN